jgi:hypothetical protein
MNRRARLAVLAFAASAALSPAFAASTSGLNFSAAATADRPAIKALMEKESGTGIEDKWLGIAPLPAGPDGEPQVLAMAINVDYFCGDAGCRPELLTKLAAGWTKIDLGLDDFINSDPDDWSVEKNPELGHIVLVLTESKFKTRFVWDGSGYSSAD